MDKQISNLLQEIRTTTKWSETELATAIGTSQPTVHRILNGQDDCRGKTDRAIRELHAEKVPPEPTKLIEGKPIDGAAVRETKRTRRVLITDRNRSID